MIQENIDLLTDIETRIVQASGGKRFVNFLIDMIFENVIFVILYEGIKLLTPDIYLWLNSDESWGIVTNLMINILFYGSCIAVIEFLSKGRSLGKLITGTKAVRQDGSPITIGDAFARGFIRLVPFEIFSALGSPSYPWHDKWTKTYVIDLKESVLKPEPVPVV